MAPHGPAKQGSGTDEPPVWAWGSGFGLISGEEGRGGEGRGGEGRGGEGRGGEEG